MTMTHPGLPFAWGIIIWAAMLVVGVWALIAPLKTRYTLRTLSLVNIPTTHPGLLLSLRIIMVGLFLLVIVAGLYGTQIPERNLATVLTWNVWWAGLVLLIFFLGSAWCGVCPWDTLATWVVRHNRLNLTVPKRLRNLWPACLMFIGLTWLELGAGITTNPYTTALLALLMVVLATLSLAIFEKKAFCHHFCPIGRTIGFYAQLAPVELRPLRTDVCADCESLACYHGSATTPPCPTQLVMGRLTQNTYCTSCGNCVQSCPHDNVVWRLRPPGAEAVQHARPHWDEAWFMLMLMALTAFHGLTMLPLWEQGSLTLARWIGDSGQLFWTFTLGLALALILPLLPYGVAILATQRLTHTSWSFRRTFNSMAFVAIPLAFAYHIAHNLNHLLREHVALGTLLANPLGLDTLPLSMLEKHQRHLDMLISQEALYTLQSTLMLFGFILAVLVIRYRGVHCFPAATDRLPWRLLPMLLFALGATAFHLWLLSQPMIMRM